MNQIITAIIKLLEQQNKVSISLIIILVITLFFKYGKDIISQTSQKTEIEKLFLPKDEVKWHFVTTKIYDYIFFILFLTFLSFIFHGISKVEEPEVLVEILGWGYYLSLLLLLSIVFTKKVYSTKDKIKWIDILFSKYSNFISKIHINFKKSEDMYLNIFIGNFAILLLLYSYFFASILFNLNGIVWAKILIFSLVPLLFLSLYFRLSKYFKKKGNNYKYTLKLIDEEFLKENRLFIHYTIKDNYTVLSKTPDETKSDSIYLYDSNQNILYEIKKIIT
ncbi:hypothetical protein LC040_12375 [Bacillus tianshenii]|nr:hypothetical protein LC040_12375 [Bacillus tianshenii]